MDAAAVVDDAVPQSLMQQLMIHHEFENVFGRIRAVQPPVDRQRVGRIVIFSHGIFRAARGPGQLRSGDFSAEVGLADADKDLVEVERRRSLDRKSVV